MKLTNVEKLETIGILGDIRQRLGAKDENDQNKDVFINKLSNHQIMGQWSGWEIGDPSWWIIMKGYYDALERLDQE